MKRVRRSKLVLGLMSGTSADGIDVALVRISGRPPRLRAKLEDFVAIPFPQTVRAGILHVAEQLPVTAGEISQLNFLLGDIFGKAALQALKRFRVSPRRVWLIGSHGQTIFHQGSPASFLGAPVASTLQIGEPAAISAQTGIPVVADSRPADMAAGGQGAPLVPFVDYLLYRHARRGRVALNIGGIANLTVIPAGAATREVIAFDTGPGNMVVDSLVKHFSRGQKSFDRGARIAASGRLLPPLMNRLLRDSYYRRRPPKSAGREQYGHEFVAQIVSWGRRHRSRPQDLIRTATLLTSLSILDALHRFVLPRTRVHDLIVSGGGAHNPLMIAQLQAGLRGIQFLSSDEFGVPQDAKEAFAFAILAYETFHGRPANVPRATGARQSAILGKLVYPPPR